MAKNTGHGSHRPAEGARSAPAAAGFGMKRNTATGAFTQAAREKNSGGKQGR